MRLVRDLTIQLGGTLELCREQGTAFGIVFPAAAA
jgi:two-component sensor histidine kinase